MGEENEKKETENYPTHLHHMEVTLVWFITLVVAPLAFTNKTTVSGSGVRIGYNRCLSPSNEFGFNCFKFTLKYYYTTPP